MARLMLVVALLLWTGPLAAQRTHVIRLTQSADGTILRFIPSRLTVRAGDVVEFRAERGAPFVVGFDSTGVDARGRGLIAAALSRPRGELRTPVLADSGAQFRLTVPALAPGSYRLVCLTHISYRMSGLLVVQ